MKIAVVIPCYKTRNFIDSVLGSIGPEVEAIYVVDDNCPQATGDHVEAHCRDSRVSVLRNATNLGVGGAMVRGYRQALADGADIVVKMDGDGQMDAAQIPRLLRPILDGRADYSKGNRFAARFQMLNQVRRNMPPIRLFGNSVLSFLHKAMSGYWNIMDCTNGYTAIHRSALSGIQLDGVAHGYFFETDMLFNLNLIEAVVCDVPMPTIYADEESHLNVRHVLLTFPPLMLRRFFRRILFKYFINDFNVASLELLVGLPLFMAGVIYGAYRWTTAIEGPTNTPGTVMLAALPIILGFQLLLSALSYDINNLPKVPLSTQLN